MNETMQIGFRTVDGTRIRYAESSGPAERTILLTSPWPESLYAFAPIWSSIAARARLFAVDLPSFGGSSAATAVPIRLRGALEEWVLAPDIDRFRVMDPRTIVGAALDTIVGYALPPEIRENYLESYEGDRFVESMRYVRSYPDELPGLARTLPEIETPVLIIAGRRDRAVPPANAEFLDERLPSSKLVVLDAGHFVWEEAAGDYASLVAEWVAGGYRAAAERAPTTTVMPLPTDGGNDEPEQ